MTDERQKKGISRRTVVKGAAWAVPAVPLVVATPAYAASPQCITLTITGTACRWTGAGNNWSYYFGLCFTNSCGGTYTIYVDRLVNNSDKPFTQCGACDKPFPVSGPVTLGPGDTCFGPCAYSSTSSAVNIEVWGSFSPISTSNPATLLFSVPAPTQACQTPNPCI